MENNLIQPLIDGFIAALMVTPESWAMPAPDQLEITIKNLDEGDVINTLLDYYDTHDIDIMEYEMRVKIWVDDNDDTFGNLKIKFIEVLN